MSARWEFRILGPLEVRLDDGVVRIAGPRQRALLALLLCNANRVVSRDQLIEELLSDQPGDSADRMLRVQLSRLRSALSAAGGEPRLIAQPPGYLLRIEAGELDLHEFERLVNDGRAALERGDPSGATVVLRRAESLWRGQPLADLEFEPLARLEIRRLEELRLCAVEERIEAELALGRHAGLCPELEALVGEHPLRERFRGQLMLALYRCARQADALAVYRAGRSLLVDELALEPSPKLQRLEQAILRQDGALELGEPPAAPTGVAVLSPPEPQANLDERPREVTNGGHRRRPRLASGLAVAAFVGVGVAVVGLSGGGDRRVSAIAADSVGAINPAGGVISTVVPAGSSPSGVAAGNGAVWVSNYNAGTVSRIDPTARVLVQTVQVGSTPSGIAVGAGAVWVANTYGGTVSRIDPAVNNVVQTIPVGNGPSGVAVGEGSVWVANTSDGTLSRIDAVSGVVRATIALGSRATDVATGYGAVWVTDEPGGRVLRVDPQTDQVTDSINVGTGPTAITEGFGSIWVTNSLDGTVSRIDPATNRVSATVPVGDGPGAAVAGAGGMWIANEFGGTVVRIDPATDAVARRVSVGDRPRGLAIAGGLVWVGAQASATSHRGGTLTVLSNIAFDTNDPALSGLTAAPVLTLYMTNDGLTAFKRVGGSDGTQVVPDLAMSLPTPTDGGRTYTFELRRGIRYSDGQPVRPGDFRRAIERGLKVGAFAYVEYYQSIVGGAACVARPARCDLSRGIVTNDAMNTVTFHLAAPDPEFLDRLALVWAVAVPPGTPTQVTRPGSLPSMNLPNPLPATGPYEIATYSPAHEVRLVRNPYFHEWSHAARPAGYPDQIVWKIGASPSAAVTAIEQGRADYTLDTPPPARLGELRTRFASQLHSNLIDFTAALFLNTRVAPFTDVRVRQALNYAVDRGRVATLIGEASQPTCQLLPPIVAGYRRYCPYTIHPNAAGVWSAPDLGKARSLIAASGTYGMSITIWNQPSYGADYTATGRYLVSLLDSLGYRARLKTFTANDLSFQRFADPRTKGQAAFSTAVSAYPAASEYIQFLFNCGYILGTGGSLFGSNISEFCSPRLDATIRRAFAAEGANSPTAADLWTDADRQITNAAPLVPLVNPSQLDFVSRRAGNYQYDPEQGALLDQLWVK